MAYQPVPATQTTGTSSLPHIATVFYKRKALDRLMTKFQFEKACMPDMLERQQGKTVQFWRYTNLQASTAPKSPEGQVGTSETISSKTLSATISQYTNFITVSDLLRDTAIDPILENAAELLGYQAGLTVDTITRTIIDNESANTAQTLLGTYLRAADFRRARHTLQGKDILPMEDNYFLGIAHPYVTFDLVNDPQAAGLADITKYTNPDKARLFNYEDRGVISVVGGVKVMESTNVLQIAGSPNKWRAYIFGKNGVGAVDLAGRGPSRGIVDPSKQRFSVRVIPRSTNDLFDPEGIIGGACAYNFSFVVVVLQGPAGIGGTYRYATIDCPSSIVS